MPKGYPPSVFVSSTCYDLSQVRLDLERFIEGLGYNAMISESRAFPVSPQASTVENCLTAVRDRTDIFVLIIGNRFGTPQQGGRSITNLEYLEAKARQVPIYVFVAKGIISNLKIWKKNPDADFSDVVDDSKLFAFVDELRNESGKWMYEFNEVKDIVDTLRQQWAILFMESLLTHERLQTAKYSASLMNLPADSLRILLERPVTWEGRLLSSVLRKELESLSTLRRDLKYGLQIRAGRKLEGVSEVMNWLGFQMGRALRLGNSASSLMNIAAKEAFGPLGQAGDPELLVYVGQRLAELDRQMLQWKLEFAEIEVDEQFARIAKLLAAFCDEFIEKLEELPDVLDSQLHEAQEALKRGEKAVVSVQITLGSPITAEYEEEMAHLQRIYGPL